MANPIGTGLAVLVSLLSLAAWFQFAGALPGSESALTHIMASLVSGIAGFVAYAWAENVAPAR